MNYMLCSLDVTCNLRRKNNGDNDTNKKDQ